MLLATRHRGAVQLKTRGLSEGLPDVAYNVICFRSNRDTRVEQGAARYCSPCIIGCRSPQEHEGSKRVGRRGGQYFEHRKEHVMGSHFNSGMRVHSALDDGAGGYCSPRHRVPVISRDEGARCVGRCGKQYLAIWPAVPLGTRRPRGRQ